jgi:two-component system OmpR family sensor kinase
MTAPCRPGDESHATVVDAVPVRRALTDLGAPLMSMLALRKRSARRRHHADMLVDERVPPLVRIDVDKIGWISALVVERVVHVRHGSPGQPGSVAVRVGYQAIRPSVVIEVQDDGPGIPAEKLPVLFEAAPDGSRAALGLLIVRDFVVAHAGRIEVVSGPEAAPAGTTIRITLPI